MGRGAEKKILSQAAIAYGIDNSDEIAISSAEDLLAMEENPSGIYYLTKDITVPENMTLFTCQDEPFSGTLDGKGHKIVGYKTVGTESEEEEETIVSGLFTYAEDALFKNLTLSDVDIQITGEGDACAGALVSTAYQCEFSKVTVSGTMSVKASGNYDNVGWYYIGGIAGIIGDSISMTGCENRLAITVNASNAEYVVVGGLIGGVGAGEVTIKNCSNYGKISVTADTESYDPHVMVAGLVGESTEKITGSKNSGNITVSMTSSLNDEVDNGSLYVAGLTGNSESVSSSSNSGKISASTVSICPRDTQVAGLVGLLGETLTKSYNTGRVSFSGAGGKVADYNSGIGGLVGTSYGTISQSYNTGKITANNKDGEFCHLGGILGGSDGTVKNCYNTGTVKLTGTGDAGGIAGVVDTNYGKIIYNYNTGTVSGSVSGSLIGHYSGGIYLKNRGIYNNYYTGKKKAYGALESFYNEKTTKKPAATKVSSFTLSNCSNLSNKIWTYSKSKGRLILKNNKEK